MNGRAQGGDPFAFVPDFDRPLGQERSLFLLCVDLVQKVLPDRQGLGELCGMGRGALETSVFWLRDRDLLSLGTAVVPSCDPHAIARAAVRDLVSEDEAPQSLCSELRYCLLCLARGCHSSLFQHWALPICPVHSEPLRCGCPECGQSIKTDITTIARALMTCDHCGELFERGAGNAPGKTAPLTESAFVPYRKALPPRFADLAASTRRLLSTSDARSAIPLREQALHRFRIWPEGPLPGYRRRTATEFSVVKEGSTPPSSMIVEEQIARTLAKLQALLIEEACFGPCPSSLSLDHSRGFRIDGESLTGAAAFWKTTHIYRLSKFLVEGRPRTPPRISHFGYGCFISAAVWQETLEMEVLGFFVRVLLEVNACRCLFEVDWERTPPNSSFLPAWRLFDEGSTWTLEVRPVTDWLRLRKLIQRYGSIRLWTVPKNRTLLESLSMSTSFISKSRE